MIHYIVFAAVFVAALAFNFWVYTKNYDKLAVYHRFSVTIDILVWIGAGATLAVAFIFLKIAPDYWHLIWIAVLFATASLTIHIVRFIIGFSKKHKK